jgi:hypothetical protein
MPFLGICSISILCKYYGFLYFSIVEIKWCTTFLDACFLHVDGYFLVDKGFSCFLLELVRNFLNIVGNFYLSQTYYCIKTIGGVKGYTPSTKPIIIVG